MNPRVSEGADDHQYCRPSRTPAWPSKSAIAPTYSRSARLPFPATAVRCQRIRESARPTWAH